MSGPPVPAARIRVANRAPVRGQARYVLHWMIAARRTRRNFALERALHHADELGLPLLVFEPLRAGNRWASRRLHRFVLDGMADNARRLAGRGIASFPYVEPSPGDGKGLLETLAADAAVVTTDHFPGFFLPRMVAAAARKLDVRLEVVDGNGIVPLAETDRAYPTAASFRRFLQRALPEHLGAFPVADPLAGRRFPSPAAIPPAVTERWPAAAPALLDGSDPAALAAIDVDAAVAPVDTRGGPVAGARVLQGFLRDRLPAYGEHRSEPETDAASGLSPYLHFGHVSIHDVVADVLEREEWTPLSLGPVTGSRSGWWGVSATAESFLDEAVTWREVGAAFAHHRPEDHDRYESLPDWARATLAEHAGDPRPHLYDPSQLEAASTHDPLWNAAQTQLLREGRMHNYLRMLWGKKILEWSPSPRAALDVMIELNNRWALDGRDPNSYSGIFWVLGRFDRPWGPERPIFGKIRYMTSESTARKFRVKDYVRRYSPRAEDLFGGC